MTDISRHLSVLRVPCAIMGESGYVDAFAAEHRAYLSPMPSDEPVITLYGRIVEHLPPPPEGSILERLAGNYSRYESADRLFLSNQRSTWLLERNGDRLYGYGFGLQGPDLLEMGRAILEATVCFSLEQAGRISIHGAALSVAGKGILVTGDSGAGKTTLALQLSHRSGGALVADDTCLYEPESGLLHGFLPHVAIYGDQQEADVYEYSSGITRSLTQPESLGLPRADRAPHRLALFVQPVRGSRSTLTQLGRQEAFRFLAPRVANGVKSFFRPDSPREPELIQQRLRGLHQLVEESPVYVVQAGRDPAEVAGAVASLL